MHTLLLTLNQKDIKNVLCTCYVCTSTSPAGCKVSKATKRSHEQRYEDGFNRKKSIGKTVQFDAFLAKKQLQPQSTPITSALSPVLESILKPPEIEDIYRSDYYPEARRSVLSPDPVVSYASPELVADDHSTEGFDYSGDSMDYNGEPMDLDQDHISEITPVDSLQPDEPEGSAGSGEGSGTTDNRIQPGRADEQDNINDDAGDSGVPATANEDAIQFHFEVPEPPLPATEVLAASSDSWVWRIMLLFTSWAHVAYHVPVKVLEVLLKILQGIFITLESIAEAAEAPTSLKTSFKWLGLEDTFQVLPMCILCRRIFNDDDLTANSVCTYCDKPLFKEVIKRGGKNRHVPILQFPFRSLSSQLPEFLNREGVEDALDAWRSRSRSADGTLRDIMDGQVWQELKDPDGNLFFNNDPRREDKDELRIGITLGFDG